MLAFVCQSAQTQDDIAKGRLQNGCSYLVCPTVFLAPTSKPKQVEGYNYTENGNSAQPLQQMDLAQTLLIFLTLQFECLTLFANLLGEE